VKKKYHPVKWAKITKPKEKGGLGIKEKGGLGIKDLRKLNISLLCKWWWNVENGRGIWQEIVKMKYMKNGGIAHISKGSNNSPVCNDLLKVRHIYLSRRSMLVGNGKDTSFWHNKWCGHVSLKDNFPQLFEINKEQFWSVATMKNRNWRLTFRRWLHEDLQSQLRRLQDILYICSVNDEP
jgi:hypothetical protein